MPDTTKTTAISPTELAKCSKSLRQQWEDRKIDEKLVQRAWAAAYQMATVLYEDYGASKVAVFGSLTQPICFTEHSDIDIVVWGVSYNKCLDALWETDGLPTEFEIDLIDAKSINRLFRQRILNEAIPIDKDEIDEANFVRKTNTTLSAEAEGSYEVNYDKLIQRITDEKEKIERTIQGISNALQDSDVIAEKHRKYVEKTIASDLVEIFNGIEKVFERIAREVDKHIPSGSKWYRDLLAQMAEHRGKRNAVISKGTEHRLNQLLKFRHHMNNIYRYELIYEKAEKHAKRIDILFDNVSKELDTFIACLRQL